MDNIISIKSQLLLFPLGVGDGRRTPAVSGGYRPAIFIDGHGFWTCTLEIDDGNAEERAELPFDRWCDVIATLRFSTYQNMLASSVSEFPVTEGSRTVGLIRLRQEDAQKAPVTSH